MDSLHRDERDRALPVNAHEYGLIVSGLRMLRKKLNGDLRRSLRIGFVPEPGAGDITKIKMATLASLMDRLGINRGRIE